MNNNNNHTIRKSISYQHGNKNNRTRRLKSCFKKMHTNLNKKNVKFEVDLLIRSKNKLRRGTPYPHSFHPSRLSNS